MAKFIRRKKQHLNEFADNQTQQTTTTAPVTQPVQQQTALATTTAPAAPAQPQDQNGQQQQQQTNNAQSQQQQQQNQNQPSQEQQQVNNFLTGVRDNIQKGNIYWALSINLADEIQKAIPTFKADNQAAKPGIDAWEAFKKDPQEQTFNTFIDELSKFGAPQQETPAQAPAEQAQQAQQLQDSLALNFGARLEEKLNNKLKMDFYAKQIAKGVND